MSFFLKFLLEQFQVPDKLHSFDFYVTFTLMSFIMKFPLEQFKVPDKFLSIQCVRIKNGFFLLFFPSVHIKHGGSF